MSLKSKYEPQIRSLQGSDTAKAAGLALAMIVNNVIALGSTVVFARLLSDYGSLAALISYFLILSVVGQAMQVATAREGVLGHLGVGHDLLATLRRWTQTMAIFTVVLTVISVVLRNPIASAVGVKHDPWAAAVGIPAGCLWLELSILRGALQGVGDYKAVGLSLIYEQGGRLITGAALAAVGLGVTGAYLGTPLSFIAMCAYCAVQLRRHVERTTGTKVEPGKVHAAAIELWTHVRRAWVPIVGLIIIAVLQNIDIIAAKHRLPGKELQSSYAATAVAAKVLIWVAIGASLYLVPEVSRRGAEGKPTRPVLFRALGIVFVCAIPVLLIFAVAAEAAAEDRVRREPHRGLGLADRARARVHDPRVHVSRDPVHARAAADMVPAAARPRRGRRADPAPERLDQAGQLRRRRARGSGGRCDRRVHDRVVALRQTRRRHPARPGRGSAAYRRDARYSATRSAAARKRRKYAARLSDRSIAACSWLAAGSM